MKPENKGTNLRRRLFGYFSIFAIVMIVFMWVLQILFMDTTYKFIRKTQIRNSSDEIISIISENPYESLNNSMTDAFRGNNISVVIYNVEQDRYLVAAENNMMNLMGRNFQYRIAELTDNLLNSTSKTLYVSTRGEKGPNSTVSYSEKDNNDPNLIAYGASAVDYNGDVVFVVIIGDLLPVDSTVSAIRVQLIIISIGLVIVAGILSTVSSRIISKPIEQLNEKTRIMSTGNLNVTFDGKGYREIEQLSDSLNETVTQLKKADQMTKDLIANVSHDLRTPLTMISGYGELIRDIPGENNRENIQVIIDEAERLTSLVNNMLDISKLQSGNIELAPTSINVMDMLVSVQNTYSKFLETNGYKLILDAEDKDYYIRADKQRLEQVLYNLINNAITHAGEDKTVILKAAVNDGMMRFDIIDHGEGIPKDELPLIWQRYYKVDKTHVRPETGSGLGLSIVRTILDLHKAEYGVESEVSRGSDFWFRLPLEENEV
ncbi:MAG: HAMP domain-containing histidine kinase [Erysipelotrichaceae bacterium]|nr:HAMP domain-containing histidine kinase [Erysipelotrichaceae bacterium]